MKNSDSKVIDRRTAQRYVNQGVLKKEDLEKHLKALPDESENAATVNLDELDPLPLLSVDSDDTSIS